MATDTYLVGRARYQRPQAVLWSNNSGTLTNGLYVPNGYEVGSDTEETDPDLLDQFIILSDHNRTELNFSKQRIEQRRRTINGRMRSFHIADKTNISFSWNMLPSRAYHLPADFNTSTGESPYKNISNQEYTADGGAGGIEILNWYETHPGPFWMFLAYDKYNNFGQDAQAFDHLAQYNQIIQVYFSDFSYNVVKRGASNHDLRSIS